MPRFDQKYSIIDFIMHIIEGTMHSIGTCRMRTILQTLSHVRGVHRRGWAWDWWSVFWGIEIWLETCIHCIKRTICWNSHHWYNKYMYVHCILSVYRIICTGLREGPKQCRRALSSQEPNPQLRRTEYVFTCTCITVPNHGYSQLFNILLVELYGALVVKRFCKATLHQHILY